MIRIVPAVSDGKRENLNQDEYHIAQVTTTTTSPALFTLKIKMKRLCLITTIIIVIITTITITIITIIITIKHKARWIMWQDHSPNLFLQTTATQISPP